jgi:hypothetical protein
VAGQSEPSRMSQSLAIAYQNIRGNGKVLKNLKKERGLPEAEKAGDVGEGRSLLRGARENSLAGREFVKHDSGKESVVAPGIRDVRSRDVPVLGE